MNTLSQKKNILGDTKNILKIYIPISFTPFGSSN